MDKNAIKRYAVWARTELIERVTQKAYQYGFTAEETIPASADSIRGRLLTASEKKQRADFINKLKHKKFEQVIEEVAYIWFNRFTAIRFMEVNGYIPSHVRVFTDEDNKFNPQILTEAIHLELPGLNMDKVIDLKQANKFEELYKYLLIVQCNALQPVLPGMFQKIEDYTELLLPDNLLREGSVIERMIKDIPEAGWTEQVEILGWMYQYYISEKHDQIINIYKGTVKKEDIPAATQLFTTDWVVRYMVDNSLGRYWIERHPESQLADKLEFFVKPKNGKINYINETVTPQEMTFFDPCMGSGHILVYAFDVLMEIYRESGYSDRDAVAEIVQHNLFGLDIDDRCSQLAYFAVMMKARSYDRRFLSRAITPNVYAIQESNDIRQFNVGRCTPDEELNKIGEYLIKAFKHAKEIGSIALLETKNWDAFSNYLDECKNSEYIDIEMTAWVNYELPVIYQLLAQAKMLTKKYAVVCTNPPYMGKLEGQLKPYVLENFKEFSGDLFSVFMYHNFSFCKQNGYSAYMTPFVWMFIKTYEQLRQYLIKCKLLTTLVQMEYSAFEEATVPICSFVFKNAIPTTHHDKSLCFRLSDFKGGMSVQKEKVLEAISNVNCGYFYESRQEDFPRIPGSPIAYWVSDNALSAYSKGRISELMDCKSGIMTGSDDYIKLWFEVSTANIKFNCKHASEMGSYKWFPLNSGGEFRKWYGNNLKLVNLWNEGAEIKANVKNYRLRDSEYYFKRGITWGRITSSQICFREVIEGSLFGDAGPIGFIEKKRHYVLGFLNSKVVKSLLQITNPTLNFQVHDIMDLPLVYDVQSSKQIEDMVCENINISKSDWDAFETSWDFIKHPLVMLKGNYEEAEVLLYSDDLEEGIIPIEITKTNSPIAQAYLAWERISDERFSKLQTNEENINKNFIKIYGLEEELDSSVDITDITVKRADLSREIRSFISYAVGCMFGRYSLNEDGLILAGEDFGTKFTYATVPLTGTGITGSPSSFTYTQGDCYLRKKDGTIQKCSFAPDKDNILPICDDEYFEDDIVGKFVRFVATVYGDETLEENLRFIAEALGGKGAPREVIRNYFLNDFYNDHLKIYQKRPIYWQFDSGKKNGFKCLIYMHRYQPDTIARIRTDYVHEQQARYRTAIAGVEQRIANASTAERVRLNKQLIKLKDQETEIHAFEEKIHHLADQMIRIDLDDGVKHNYEIFKDVLTKIK